jgi:hypothetical protein
MLLVQRPSFFIVGQTASRATAAAWDHQIGALSLGTYVLLGTMLASFAQWGLIAAVASRILASLSGNQTTGSHSTA